MTDEDVAPDMNEPPTTRPKSTLLRVAIVLVVVAFLAGILIAKAGVDRDAATNRGKAPIGATSVTSIHNNAVADYEAALKTGKPVYVLFHSLS